MERHTTNHKCITILREHDNIAPGYIISYKISFALSEDSDKSVHSLIRLFAGQSVGGKGQKAFLIEQRKL